MINHITDSIAVHDFAAAVAIDLFFSLSGFLIAQMIVERFDGIGSPAAFWAFMANRWLRTLPLYFLTLAAWMVALRFFAPEPADAFSIFSRFALFVQYIPWHRGNEAGMPFFTVSWSLAVEEWFYLLCPLVLLLAGRRPRRFFLWLFAALILASVAYRLAGYIAGMDLGLVITSTLTRTDAFIYGMAAYFVGSVSRRHLWAGLGMVLALINCLATRFAPASLYCYLLMPSIAPLSMALLIPSALSWQAPKTLRSASAWLATRTYAIYLFHTWAIVFLFAHGHRTPLRLVAFLLATGLLADFLYRYVERPFMRLRPMRAPVSAPALAE